MTFRQQSSLFTALNECRTELEDSREQIPLLEQVLELFARKADFLPDDSEGHLTPIPAGEEASSLSGILLEQGYYDFVMANRHAKDFSHDYDVVIGPVANDKVFATLTLFEAGVLDKVQAILQLKTYTLWDQYLFHTQRSLAHLKYV